MITPVGVSVEVIRESLARDLRELNAMHEDLTDALLAHGLLVLASEDAGRDFRRALADLARVAPDAEKRWEAALSSLHSARRLSTWRPPIEPPLERIRDVKSLRTSWRDAICVAFVDDEAADALGVPQSEWSFIDPESEMDITRGRSAWRSSTFRTLRELALDGCFERGTERDEVWTRFFEPLVWFSRRIVIFDRYAASNAIRRQTDPRRDEFEMTALGWLLQGIDESDMADPIEVDIFSGDDGASGGIEQFEEAVRFVLDGDPGAGAIQRIDLYMGSWGQNPRLPHDRHIRFDLGCVAELPAGLHVFNKPKLRADVSIAYRWLNRSLRKAEAAERFVRRDPNTTRATIR